MVKIKVSKVQNKNFRERKYGDDERWSRARNKRLEFDKFKCAHPGCNKSTHLEVHHRIPVTKGGSKYSLSNLITLCKEHHDARHAYSHRYVGKSLKRMTATQRRRLQ